MAVTVTPRLGFKKYTNTTDPHPGREEYNNHIDILEGSILTHQGTGRIADRPPAGTAGRIYYVTDMGGSQGRMTYDTGEQWSYVGAIGNAGAPPSIAIGGSNVEGSSLFGARSDHTHAIPFASKTQAGVLSAPHFELLQGASPSAIAGLAIRGAGGVLAVGDGTSPNHAVNRKQLDALGVVGISNNTVVKRGPSGQMRAADPRDAGDVATQGWVTRYTDPSDPYLTGGRTIGRWSDGTGGYVKSPTHLDSVVPKRYVDAKASRLEWKENIQPIPVGLEEIADLSPVVFDYRDGAPDAGKGVHGAIVEEVAKVLPGLVTYDAQGVPEAIRDRELVWVLVQAVKDLYGAVLDQQHHLEAMGRRVYA